MKPSGTTLACPHKELLPNGNGSVTLPRVWLARRHLCVHVAVNAQSPPTSISDNLSSAHYVSLSDSVRRPVGRGTRLDITQNWNESGYDRELAE